MFDVIRKALTEKDNTTWCPVRIGMVGTGVVYHAAAVFMVTAQHAAIDMAMLGQYITHMSLLGGTTAMSIGARSLSRSEANVQPVQVGS